MPAQNQIGWTSSYTIQADGYLYYCSEFQIAGKPPEIALDSVVRFYRARDGLVMRDDAGREHKAHIVKRVAAIGWKKPLKLSTFRTFEAKGTSYGMLKGLLQPAHLIFSIGLPVIGIGVPVWFAVYVASALRQIKLSLKRIADQLEEKR